MATESPSNNTGISKDDIIDALNEDDGNKEPVVLGESEAEITEEKEEKEEDEIQLVEEEEEKEDDDDLLKDVRLDAPFKKAEIEKDFPGLFKKYPYLERSYYTERAYRETFATPEEAKEAKEEIEVFNDLRE